MRVVNLSLLKLNDSHTYYGGAIGNIGYNLLESLAGLEDVEVVSFTSGTDFESSPPASLRLIEAETFDEVGATLQSLELTDRTVLTHLYFHEPEYTPLASDLRGREQPFVIGMCEPPHPRYRDEVSGLQQLPLVRPLGKRLLYGPRFRRTLAACDLLVTVNEYGRRYYRGYVEPDPVATVPYGVDHEFFSFEPLSDRRRILLVSRLIKRRGIDTLVEALPSIAQTHPDVAVDIVGEGPRRDRLERAARTHGVRDRMTFHGNVGPGALVERYRQCYAFCHLSEADGWNQPALEAMATGRPVVTIDAPHNSMVDAAETGYLVPFGDADALAGRIDRLLSDRDLAAELGRAGRQRVEETYDWDRIAGEYRRLFEEVLAGG
jgi:glycosyltransferase involved in cell wall biosynthesis